MYALTQLMVERARMQAEENALLHEGSKTQVQNGSRTFGNIGDDATGPVGGIQPPTAPTQSKNHKHKNNQKNRANSGAGGSTGTQSLLGPDSINAKLLPDVPAGSAQSSGTPPLPVIILGIGALGIGGYFLWHKLHQTHAEEKALDKGHLPGSDPAT